MSYTLVNVNDVKPEPLNIKGSAGVFTQWLVSKGNGSSKYAVRRQLIKPGGKAPLHRHAYDETFLVLNGRGVMTINGESIEVKPGVCVFVPSKMPHSIRNTGDYDLELITVISYEEDMSIEVLE
ncbi:cupin domain-containing protein [Caldivirga maquilingensis]|uniref:Cupin 2 conserved barrel domain protein n=1 Tax=Caldivirga maquilingensis (strain ATCC 700844 / DSM 13496 / JCM 10307 / IC-167) TaxID=397948 RepID=A8M9V5_CALMQ|nr:cupin domain-containing protein [Caldivirga maquilingensis]ABW02426.1 Cupin 2 conserved barrel domain protein [Caldivirga maquilingensis IC-167]